MEDIKNEEVKEFDLDEWKKQGEAAYAALGDQVEKIEDRIEQLEEQKQKLIDEQNTLGTTLGKDVVAQGDSAPRVRIRPRVLEVLEGRGELSRNEIFEVIRESVPHIKRSSFDEAVRRMVLSDEVPVSAKGDIVTLEKTQ